MPAGCLVMIRARFWWKDNADAVTVERTVGL